LVGAIALAAGCKEKNAGISTGRGQSVAYEEPTTDYYAPGTMASGQSSGYDSYGASSASYGSGNKHVVAKGETLYSIARAHYNDQAKWRTIYDANRGAISDPNKLSVGQELVIP
jgi:nucleoid-associated protein YgaU